MKPVTDPALLEQLNGGGRKPVSDPAVLAALNAKPEDEFDKRVREGQAADGGFWPNLGAGMDNVIQGAKQIAGFGDSDEVIEERRQHKKRLADSTFGGGLTQLGGEMLATLPIGMGAAGAAGKVAGKVLPKAAAWARTAGGRVFNPATVGTGIVEGATSGALAETTEPESRGVNMALGGAVGAVAPAVLAGGSALKKALGKGAAPVRAAKEFTKQLGDDGMKAVRDSLDSPLDTQLPLSTAARTQNTKLAALERGARSRGDWRDTHDKAVGEKAWELVKGATADADELPARIADRDEMLRLSKEHLNDLGSPTSMARANKAVSSEIEILRQTPVARQNARVTDELGQIEAALQHPNATPADFAEQYWRLEGLIKNASEHQAAIYKKLQDAILRGADDASNGPHFSDLLGRLEAEGVNVGEAEAAGAVRNRFIKDGVPQTTKYWDKTPEVESGPLRKALADRKVSPESREGLSKVADELSQHELSRTANSPGMSNFESGINPVSTLGTGANNPLNRISMLRGIGQVFVGGANKSMTAAADEALLTPDKWKKMIEAYEKSNSPLTKQEYLARALRQMGLTPGRAGAASTGGE